MSSTSYHALALLQSSRATQLAVRALRELYPEELADSSWDNTGLLLEAPIPTRDAEKKSTSGGKVLLTIDLTTAVAKEAVEKGVDLVVAYHPIIFRPLRSLTFANTQQNTLLRLASAGISVYCPHTAVDAVAGGNADWLADCLIGKLRYEENIPSLVHPDQQTQTIGFATAHMRSYKFQRFGCGVPDGSKKTDLDPLKHQREPIVKSASYAQSGSGRIVTLQKPQPLRSLIWNLAISMGDPPALKLAMPYDTNMANFLVSRFAVCAGSGTSVFSKINEDEVGNLDLLVTGEMSHHDALAAVEAGKAVITLGHSDSERGYLGAVMKGKLEKEMRKISPEKGAEGMSVEVLLSEMDHDPFGTLMNRETASRG